MIIRVMTMYWLFIFPKENPTGKTVGFSFEAFLWLLLRCTTRKDIGKLIVFDNFTY